MSKPKKGRPAGSQNTDATADATPSRCPSCGSTNREAYVGSKQVQEFEGTHNGTPFNRIVRRRCACSDCGQFRIDRTFEFEPPAAEPKRKNKAADTDNQVDNMTDDEISAALEAHELADDAIEDEDQVADDD